MIDAILVFVFFIRPRSCHRLIQLTLAADFGKEEVTGEPRRNQELLFFLYCVYF